MTIERGYHEYLESGKRVSCLQLRTSVNVQSRVHFVLLHYLTIKGFLMRHFKTALESLLLACVAIVVSGCGGTTDPAAGIEPEKMAPAAEDLGSDAEYAKQFGGAKK